MTMTNPESTSPKMGPVFYIGGTIVLFAFILAIVGAVGSWLHDASPTAAQVAHGAELATVRDTCESAIRQNSVNASAAVIPMPDIVDDGKTWRALWIYSNKAQLQNQFGAMIDTPIQCSVRKDTGQVDQLLIAGQKVI
jgi:hypothetical protein